MGRYKPVNTRLPKDTHGPFLEEILDAWRSPEYKGIVPEAAYVLVPCPQNVCSDKYAIYGHLSDAGIISLMGWTGTGTALTAGLLEVASRNWNGKRIPDDSDLPFEEVFGFPTGQGTAARESRSYYIVRALLMTLRGDDVNKHRPHNILPQFEPKPEQPESSV